MATRSNTLSFDDNVTYELVLKYATGKEIDGNYGPRIMFTTMSDERFFLDPSDAQKIHALGLAQNEPFQLMKRVSKDDDGRKMTSIVVRRLGEPARETAVQRVQQPVCRPAVASTTEQIATSVQPSSPQSNTYARQLASAYVAAIDGLIVAAEYAKSKGVQFRITEEEIRCGAATIFIENGKAKERAARYGHTQNAPFNHAAANGGASWQQ